MVLLDKQLEVRKSKIPGAGMGLFTTQPIAKGSRIIEYKGKIRTWEEVKNNHSNLYIFYVNENHVIDGGKSKKSLARYINDARGLQKIKELTNNTKFVVDGLQVFVVATKNIPAGGELFVGYGKEYWQIIRHNMRQQ